MSWFALAPELVWGLVPRAIGLLYVLAFAALAPQTEVLLGTRGTLPIGVRLTRIRRDFPGLRRFFDYPTVLWLFHSDRMLRILPLIGIACGLCAVYGGPLGYAGLVLAWVLWLSFEPAGLIFPWDTLLQEVGFLALFLPLSEALPQLEAHNLPLPAVAFMFRWLVLRLMLGFGKCKFVGSTSQDTLYLRGFFVWMPVPTPLGWFAHHAPRWFLKFSLGMMFFGEVIAPLLGFFSGPLRMVSYLSLVGLSVAIQATGNWGYFNIGYILLCTCLLDTQSSVFDMAKEPWASQFWHWPELAIHAALAVLFFCSLIYFALNSWCTRTWVHWPWDDLTWKRPWARALLAFFRALAPFRLTSGYGVFPPKSSPPMRTLPVFEGSDDGVTWKAYSYRHMPTFANSRPPFVAPYHPRMDQALYYAANGIHDGSFFSSAIGDGNPYIGYCRSTWLDRMAQRLLHADPLFMKLLAHNPFADAPPKWVRVSTIAMTPTRPSELRATGNWWHTRRLGTLVPPVGKAAWPDALVVTEPELFHPDFVDHKRRTHALRAISKAFADGESPDRAVLVASDLSAADVERFWTELVPMLAEQRGDWSCIHARAKLVRERFSPEQLAQQERLLERYAWLLRLRTERHHWADAQPKIPLVSNFRYHMLLHEMIIDGRSAYEHAMAEPACAAERATRTSDASQLWTLALMRYDVMMAHLRAFRWSEVGLRGKEGGVRGLFEYYELLVRQVPPEEDFCPMPVRHEDGEFSIEGLYPPPTTGSLGRAPALKPGA